MLCWSHIPLSERGGSVQDGPEVSLICRIRFLLGVTVADQGPIATIAETMAKKADQGIKADRRQQHLPGTTKRIKTGITAAKSN